jgi:hypothetical protein
MFPGMFVECFTMKTYHQRVCFAITKNHTEKSPMQCKICWSNLAGRVEREKGSLPMQDEGAGGGPASSMGGHGGDHTLGSEEGRAERGLGSERGDGGDAENVEGEGQQQVGEGGADSSEKTGGKMAGKRKRRVRERAETVEDALLPLQNSE